MSFFSLAHFFRPLDYIDLLLLKLCAFFPDERPVSLVLQDSFDFTDRFANFGPYSLAQGFVNILLASYIAIQPYPLNLFKMDIKK